MEKPTELNELAALVDGEVVGDGTIVISGFGPLESAGPGEVSFLVKDKRLDLLEGSRASAFIVGRRVTAEGRTLLRVDDPYLAAALIQNHFLAAPFVAAGVDERAAVGHGCSIPTEVSIGPFAVLGDRVTIGRRVDIGAGVVIGDDVRLGDDCTIKAGVIIERGCELGDRVVVHPGTVIGSDGYGYATDKQGRHVKRPQLGIVRVGDDVEIGANCCLDRATFGVTWIKSGTKIDNLVQVAHNVVVGENSLLVAQVGLSGSVTLGRNVVFGGKAGAAGHQHIGDGTMVAGMSAVHGDQKPGSRLAGVPAIDAKLFFRAVTAFARLPEIAREVRALKKELARRAADNGQE